MWPSTVPNIVLSLSLLHWWAQHWTHLWLTGASRGEAPSLTCFHCSAWCIPGDCWPHFIQGCVVANGAYICFYWKKNCETENYFELLIFWFTQNTYVSEMFSWENGLEMQIPYNLLGILWTESSIYPVTSVFDVRAESSRNMKRDKQKYLAAPQLYGVSAVCCTCKNGLGEIWTNLQT